MALRPAQFQRRIIDVSGKKARRDHVALGKQTQILCAMYLRRRIECLQAAVAEGCPAT